MAEIISLEAQRKARWDEQVKAWDEAEERRQLNGGALVAGVVLIPPGIAFWWLIFWLAGWL